MSRFDSPLNSIKIASPCSADWQGMFGNERKRFCGECKLNVYNLSGMTRPEAEALLLQSEGRLCVRYYRRADGTILTKDCPLGWAKVKQRMARVATAAFSLFMTLFAGLGIMSLFSRDDVPRKRIEVPISEPLMGAVAITNSETGGIAPMGEIDVPITRNNKPRN